MQTLTISPLETFQKLFPVTRLTVMDDMLNYRFRNLVTARYFEDLAQTIILANGLSITAELEIWESGGVVHEMCLVVKHAPEQYVIEHY